MTRHPANPQADASPASSTPPGAPATLDGITLEALLTTLVARHGWQGLGQRIDIRCFTTDPSIASSLKFLRKTPWARQKVEQLFLAPHD
ncbi:MAG: DUF2132 domain-containing protein [Herminiimonas sp.]|nr:DUF2132 domain-containing protein [Herminiimonas sp.]